MSRPLRTFEETVRLELPGGLLCYTLRRSSRARRLRVTVHPDRGVVVSAPWRGPSRVTLLRASHDFLRQKEPWLRRHLATHDERRRAVATPTVGDGSTLLLRGIAHQVRVVRTAASPGVQLSDAPAQRELRVALPRDREGELVAVLEQWLRREARADIARSVGMHAVSLRVVPSAITIRDQRTRWGSASRAGRLSFSWRLVLAPGPALETVVVHELAHLRVFGHGHEFWDLVASRVPDHRTWRKWLRDNEHVLRSALG